MPVKQITLNGNPLLAIAYKAKPHHSAAFKFISAFDSSAEDAKKEDLSKKSSSKAVFSGVWGDTSHKLKSDGGKLEWARGTCFFVESDLKKIILCICRAEDSHEIVLKFHKKGLKGAFGKMQPMNIIILFAAPAETKEFQLNFGDAVVLVQLTQ